VIVAFTSKRLERLYTAGVGAKEYGEQVVNAFLRRIRTLEAAVDERDVRAQKALRLEALKGKRYKGRHSIRVNDQWRLIIEFSGHGESKTVTIVELSKHYGD
jgi:proteic killer suppression protein